MDVREVPSEGTKDNPHPSSRTTPKENQEKCPGRHQSVGSWPTTFLEPLTWWLPSQVLGIQNQINKKAIAVPSRGRINNQWVPGSRFTRHNQRFLPTVTITVQRIILNLSFPYQSESDRDTCGILSSSLNHAPSMDIWESQLSWELSPFASFC